MTAQLFQWVDLILNFPLQNMSSDKKKIKKIQQHYRREKQQQQQHRSGWCGSGCLTCQGLILWEWQTRCAWHRHWSTTGRSETPARWRRETCAALWHINNPTLFPGRRPWDEGGPCCTYVPLSVHIHAFVLLKKTDMRRELTELCVRENANVLWLKLDTLFIEATAPKD